MLTRPMLDGFTWLLMQPSPVKPIQFTVKPFYSITCLKVSTIWFSFYHHMDIWVADTPFYRTVGQDWDKFSNLPEIIPLVKDTSGSWVRIGVISKLVCESQLQPTNSSSCCTDKLFLHLASVFKLVILCNSFPKNWGKGECKLL